MPMLEYTDSDGEIPW